MEARKDCHIRGHTEDGGGNSSGPVDGLQKPVWPIVQTIAQSKSQSPWRSIQQCVRNAPIPAKDTLDGLD